MSLEVIEMMIKESLKDGEISENERETIINQGVSLGVSKDIIISIIDKKVKEVKCKKENAQKVKEILYRSIVEKDHEAEYRERFKKSNRDTLYNLIVKNNGKMPKDILLELIESVEKSWVGPITYSINGYDEEYEFPARISRDWFVGYVKELEKEYSDKKKLLAGDGFVNKIKGLFKK